ncbi:MAG: type IV toxin-antitoxin system AbiEi family antitoxin domain-containing protein [bacterium]
MNTLNFIKKLKSFSRDYFTIADLEKITGLSRPSLKVALSRFVKQGALIRLKRGVYAQAGESLNIVKIANQLYYPSYLSFESALSYYGILSQIPYTTTFAAAKPPKKISLGETDIEFRQIKKSLFFGYSLKNGVYIADAEKALFDQLYMASLGRASLNIKELDLRKIKISVLNSYIHQFPVISKDKLNEVKKYIGSSAITLETGERV